MGKLMLKMKLIVLIGPGILVMLHCKPKAVTGCTDPAATNFDPKATQQGNPNPCVYTGQVVFWQGQGAVAGTVTISDQRGVISTSLASEPACGAQGCATFSLLPGTYNYDVSYPLLSTSGKVTITAQECARRRTL